MAEQITVQTKELTKACYTPARKARVKRSNNIAENIYFDGALKDKLIVSAPTHTTILEGQGIMVNRFSINAKEMHNFMTRLDSLAGECCLSIYGDKLSLQIGTTKFTITVELR